MVDNGNKAFELSPKLQGIEVSLDEADVSLDDGSFILDPVLLRLDVIVHVSILEVLDVLVDHLLLDLVGSILFGFGQVLVGLLEEGCEFTVLELDMDAILN